MAFFFSIVMFVFNWPCSYLIGDGSVCWFMDYIYIYIYRPKVFDVFLTVHHSIDFSKYQLSAQFF